MSRTLKKARTRWLAAAVLLASAVVAGCASMSVVPPEVTLVDLQLVDMTVFETAATMQVRIANENPEPLMVVGSVIRVYLNGRKIGKALSSERLQVARLDSAILDLDLTVSNLGLARSMFETVESEQVRYRVDGHLFVETDFGRRRLGFDKQAELDLSTSSGRLTSDSEANHESSN